MSQPELVHVASVAELTERGRRVVTVGRAPVLVLHEDGRFHAIDNRCPHMGFPLSQGDVHDGLLDCHWHHARFDVTCGATLDPWADDVDAYDVVVRDGEVYVDPTRPERDEREHGLGRLRRGLEDGLSLVVAKSVVALDAAGVDVVEPLRVVTEFGARERSGGWASGLSITAAMANVLPVLDPVDRERALFHGFRTVGQEVRGSAPRRPLPALSGSGRDAAGLTTWFRETIEVRDRQGAERVLATILREHGADAALRAVLLACTDHRYIDTGHTLDFAAKCAELVDRLGDCVGVAELAITSLVPQLVGATRREETSAWRRPVDVATIVTEAAARVPAAAFQHDDGAVPDDEEALIELLLSEDPAAAADDLIRRLRDGQSPVGLTEVVIRAATRRVIAFGTANELVDWDTVHHTLTYANAVGESLRRHSDPELFRGVLDAAMGVYLDRFLNIPPAGSCRDGSSGAESALRDLLRAYDGRASVDEATTVAWRHLDGGGARDALLRTLGTAVLREDAGFHAFQQLELAWRRTHRRPGSAAADEALVAAARWIAARFPTPRGREQTFGIARRLHRGDPLHE